MDIELLKIIQNKSQYCDYCSFYQISYLYVYSISATHIIHVVLKTLFLYMPGVIDFNLYLNRSTFCMEYLVNMKRYEHILIIVFVQFHMIICIVLQKGKEYILSLKKDII